MVSRRKNGHLITVCHNCVFCGKTRLARIQAAFRVFFGFLILACQTNDLAIKPPYDTPKQQKRGNCVPLSAILKLTRT